MTLCIAALCSEDGESAATHAVASCDSRIETDFVGANMYFKFVPITERWSALFAGDEAEYNELITEYRRYLLENEKELDPFNALTKLVEPANIVRARRAETCTQRSLKIPYAEFLKHGKQQLPDETHRAILEAVIREEIEADLLLVGPLGGEVTLFTYDGEEHTIDRVFDFAAIGSGDTIAEASIFQRKHDQFETLQRTLYKVYEAQRNGQSAPGVGDDIALVVIDQTGSFRQVGPAGIATLKALYENNFGPRKLVPRTESVKRFLNDPLGDDFWRN